MEEVKKRRRFDAAFKAEAVAMVSNGRSQADVARQLGIEVQRLSHWKKQLGEHGTIAKAFPGNGVDRDAELVKLRRELAQVRMERDILKKAALIFAQEPKGSKR
jgi:transposase